jgi:ribosomal protein L11 methyltransferase
VAPAALYDLLLALLDDFSPSAVENRPAPSAGGPDVWRVFFSSPGARDAAAAALGAAFTGNELLIAAIDVPDGDWARRAQADLRAIRIGRLVVAPPWDVPAEARAASEPVIVIEPSMGFGTGHHATTRLCLTALQTIELAGRCATDVGTGSGVLALAAWRLGAARVLAFDHDADALAAARTNVDRNGASACVELRRSDLEEGAGEPADVVLANLTGAALRRHAGSLLDLARRGGVLILSGMLSEETHAVAAAFRDRARIAWRADEDGWVGLLLRV